MATIICVDGLGGHPETTFKDLEKALEKKHHVLVLDTSEVSTHEDRVTLTLSECQSAIKRGERVVLVGQSAGGSAVRIAAERLRKDEKSVAGIVLLSPAMPRGIFFMTLPLLRVIGKYLPQIVLGKPALPSEDDYLSLVAPLPEDMRHNVISRRSQVSGNEARELALFPPRFIGHPFPTLLVYGDADRWIAPRAHRTFGGMLCKNNRTTVLEVRGAGHLTLASDRRHEVCRKIVEWVAN